MNQSYQHAFEGILQTPSCTRMSAGLGPASSNHEFLLQALIPADTLTIQQARLSKLASRARRMLNIQNVVTSTNRFEYNSSNP
jgi:hypothetical protein